MDDLHALTLSKRCNGRRTAQDHFVNVSSLDQDTCKAKPGDFTALGPQCPLLARKFPPDTTEAVLNLLSDCKTRLKILVLEDCRRHFHRQLMGFDGSHNLSAWAADSMPPANGMLGAAELQHWQHGMHALMSEASGFTEERMHELLEATSGKGSVALSDLTSNEGALQYLIMLSDPEL